MSRCYCPACTGQSNRRHGIPATYSWGCHCPACDAANDENNRLRREARGANKQPPAPKPLPVLDRVPSRLPEPPQPLRPDPDWRFRAACIGANPGIFFTADKGTSQRNLVKARKICVTCPVRWECLEYAVYANEPGTWGGTSFSERQEIRQVRGLPSTDLFTGIDIWDAG